VRGSPRKPLLRRLERAIFEPQALPPSLVTGLALAPSILAALVLFRVRATLVLAVALAAGGAAHGVLRLLGSRTRVSPVVPALIGVGLLGPRAALPWLVAVAAGAVLLEVLRARLCSALPLETGLLAFAAVVLARGAAVAGYGDEPIRLWLDGAAPLAPIQLYVGVAAGPVFAASLLAVVVGAGWAWYARRVNVLVVAGFLAGGLGPALIWRWPLPATLETAPLWFTVAFVLSDPARLPPHRSLQVTIGVVAGALALELHGHHVALAGSLVVLAGIHTAVAVGLAVQRLTARPQPRARQPARPSAPPLPAQLPPGPPPPALPPPGGTLR
jgi:hypothetical protein